MFLCKPLVSFRRWEGNWIDVASGCGRFDLIEGETCLFEDVLCDDKSVALDEAVVGWTYSLQSR
jgi:hypothetical protein